MHARFATAFIAAPAVLLAAGSAMAAADRYGPPIRETLQQPDPAPRTYLSWPGKAEPALAARPLRPAESPTGFPPPAHSRPAAPVRTAALAALPHAIPASATSSAPVAAAPAPPPASPAPAAVAQNGAPPRFYSVHREFGVSPDPIPLPAQFFADGAAADLAGPPPPPAPHLIAGQSASSAANVQRAAVAANLADGDPTTGNASP